MEIGNPENPYPSTEFDHQLNVKILISLAIASIAIASNPQLNASKPKLNATEYVQNINYHKFLFKYNYLVAYLSINDVK